MRNSYRGEGLVDIDMRDRGAAGMVSEPPADLKLVDRRRTEDRRALTDRRSGTDRRRADERRADPRAQDSGGGFWLRRVFKFLFNRRQGVDRRKGGDRRAATDRRSEMGRRVTDRSTVLTPQEIEALLKDSNS